MLAKARAAGQEGTQIRGTRQSNTGESVAGASQITEAGNMETKCKLAGLFSKAAEEFPVHWFSWGGGKHLRLKSAGPEASGAAQSPDDRQQVPRREGLPKGQGKQRYG